MQAHTLIVPPPQGIQHYHDHHSPSGITLEGLKGSLITLLKLYTST